MGQMRVRVRLQIVMEMNNSLAEKAQDTPFWGYFKSIQSLILRW